MIESAGLLKDGEWFDHDEKLGVGVQEGERKRKEEEGKGREWSEERRENHYIDK